MPEEKNNTSSYYRQIPRSDLDLNLQLTNTVWGTPYISGALKDRLQRYYVGKDKEGNVEYDEEGNPIVTTSSLWELLGFYTRDMRLANLSVITGEVAYCQYYLDLANDMLHADMVEPFLICLSRVATVLELSQSKGGFLRRRMNTFTSESMQGELGEQKKRTLFGSSKQRQ